MWKEVPDRSRDLRSKPQRRTFPDRPLLSWTQPHWPLPTKLARSAPPRSRPAPKLCCRHEISTPPEQELAVLLSRADPALHASETRDFCLAVCTSYMRNVGSTVMSYSITIRAQQFRRFLGRSWLKTRRRLGLLKGNWAGALPGELGFWEWALRDGGRNWNPTEWRNCTNPDFELQPELRELIPAETGAVVRILDVGSGPLTRVGKKWAGREVRVVPVDPLADQYNALFARISLRPLVPPLPCDGEKLLEKFEPNFFDLAYASNSLDHSYDPVAAIGQMLAVVKPQHYLYLWHAANEGLRERYTGLHQWNFDYRGGEFVVSDGRHTRSLSEIYRTQAEVRCQFEVERGSDVRIIVARLRKIGPRPD